MKKADAPAASTPSGQAAKQALPLAASRRAAAHATDAMAMIYKNDKATEIASLDRAAVAQAT